MIMTISIWKRLWSCPFLKLYNNNHHVKLYSCALIILINITMKHGVWRILMLDQCQSPIPLTKWMEVHKVHTHITPQVKNLKLAQLEAIGRQRWMYIFLAMMSMKGFFPFHESPSSWAGDQPGFKKLYSFGCYRCWWWYEYVRRIMQKHNKHFLSEAAWKFHGVEAVALQKERNPIVTPELNNNNIACWFEGDGHTSFFLYVRACLYYLRTCVFFKNHNRCVV